MTALHIPRFEIPAVSLALASDEPLAEFITESDLVGILMESRGAKIVTIETKTEPRLLAKHPLTGRPNPLKGNVLKISRVNGMIGWDYASSVNRQRVREELTNDFEAFPRAWGKRLSGTPLVEHDGRHYIELKVQRSLGHQYETCDGRALDAEEVEAFMPQRRPSRQGVEREIILRDYAVSSIMNMRMDGTTYVIHSTVEIGMATDSAASVAA